MSIRFWTADTHFNHPNIIRYCNRPQLKIGDLLDDGSWISGELAVERTIQMNKALIRDANMRVKMEDTVISVGDFACKGGEKGVAGLNVKPIELLCSCNGKWILVEGNHDDNNGVKADCSFMETTIGKYRVGVQHRPLLETGCEFQGKYRIPDWKIKRELFHAEYCRKMFDFVICGHVHNAWQYKVIAGILHINVGVDVNRYMPINDTEVVAIYEKAKKHLG